MRGALTLWPCAVVALLLLVGVAVRANDTTAAASRAATANTSTNTVTHILILGLDGLDRTQLRRAMADGRAPHLHALAARSSFTWNARGVQPSVSYPNWMSILGAVATPFHGVDGNDWLDYASPTEPVGGRCKRQPNVFTVLRQWFPASTMGAFYEWPTIGQILQPAHYLNVSRQAVVHPTDEDSTQAAAAFIQQHRPLMTFLYFDEIDEVGHAHGFGREYDQAIAETDQRVGKVLGAVRDAGMMDRTMVFVVSDHGRRAPRGTFHGWFTTGEISTFWAVAGPGIRRGHEITAPVAHYDMAPTILRALQRTPPVDWRGRAVAEVFENTALPVLGLPVMRGNASVISSWRYVEQEDGPAVEQCLSKAGNVSTMLLFWGSLDKPSFWWGMGAGACALLILLLLLGSIAWLVVKCTRCATSSVGFVPIAEDMDTGYVLSGECRKL